MQIENKDLSIAARNALWRLRKGKQRRNDTYDMTRIGAYGFLILAVVLCALNLLLRSDLSDYVLPALFLITGLHLFIQAGYWELIEKGKLALSPSKPAEEQM